MKTKGVLLEGAVLFFSALVMISAAESDMPRLLLVSLGYGVALLVTWYVDNSGDKE